KWAAGEPDDLEWLRPWCDQVRQHVAAGKVYRRVHVISEPLSDYPRWSHSIMQPHVDAGTDMRWMPRRQGSSIAFPGNDFWMFDSRFVVFHHYAGKRRQHRFHHLHRSVRYSTMRIGIQCRVGTRDPALGLPAGLTGSRS